MSLPVLRLFFVGVFAAATGMLPVLAQAQGVAEAAGSAAGAIENPLSSIFGEKGDMELREAINYPDCFEYKEKTTFTLHPKCTSGFPPVPMPVYKYKVEHTEPTVLVEAVFQPGAGVLQTESSLESIMGQGGLASSFLGGGEGAQAYVGNQNPNMPTMGRLPNVYFDAHVWGVGPLGFLEATKGASSSPVNMLAGGAADAVPSTVTDALPEGPVFGDAPVPGLVGESDLTAMKSMICWIAEAEAEKKGRWFPDPLSASTHLKLLAVAPELYVRARLANWGSTWFNKAGSAEVSAASAGSFIDSFGDHSSLLLAGAGALIGYAITQKDPEYTCNAQRAVTEANQAAKANQAAVQANASEYSSLAQEATYLPAGYDQENVGYDTCPLTGSGHYLDENDNIHYVNCDPEERIIKMNCSTGQAQLVDSAPGTVDTWLAPNTNPCAGNQGQKFGSDPHLYVRAPSCVNRLSSFQENGKYLACNSKSTTYTSCGRTISGTGSMPYPPPLKGVPPSGEKTGSFSFCAAPSGSTTVNQLAEFNQGLEAELTGVANGTVDGMEEAQDQIDNVVAQQGADCSKSGGNNGLLGAAVGAAAGYGIGELTSNIGSVTNSISDAAGFGPLQDNISQFSGTITDSIGSVTGSVSDAVGSVTGAVSDTVGSVKGAVSDAVGGVTAPINDAIGSVKSEVSGTLGSLADSAGLGGLSGVSPGNVMAIMNGSTSAMLDLATQLDILPESLATLISAFNQDKMIPLYISEHDRSNWRSESPGSKLARMASMQSVPLASSVVGFSRNLSQVNCGEVGVWGQLCPLRGFVETSGNNMPASGLAAWRAYHKALPKVPDRKRMIDRPTAFNLDYPHTSACYEVGEEPETWESRRSDRGGGIFGGGGLGGLFGGFASGGLGNFIGGIAGNTGLGSMFGSPEDSRIETGVFVYTYWRETECNWQVCSLTGKVLDFDSKK